MSAPDSPRENSRAAEDALQWMRGAHAETALTAEVGRLVRVRQRRRAALFAGVGVAAMAVGLWFFSDVRPPASSPPTAIVTEPRRQTLPDGSVVILREGAEIAADFSATVRRVSLRRGEAHFAVEKDPARPFVVSANGVEVRAVGTAFSVGLGGAAVDVLVTHGRVAVEPAARVAALVDAGQRARVPATGGAAEVHAVSANELAQALAWRAPQIEFSRTPLAEAVALINARLAPVGSRRLTVDSTDAALRDLRLSGFLAADNTEGFLLLLESNFGVRADRRGTGAIVLRSQR
jgi:transmembrane sensor